MKKKKEEEERGEKSSPPSQNIFRGESQPRLHSRGEYLFKAKATSCKIKVPREN